MSQKKIVNPVDIQYRNKGKISRGHSFIYLPKHFLTKRMYFGSSEGCNIGYRICLKRK